MGGLGQTQGIFGSYGYCHGVKAVGLVEGLVLGSVYHVKSPDPQGHSGKEHYHGIVNGACYCHPASCRSHGHGNAANIMAQAGKSLHIWIDDKGHCRHWQQLDADRIQLQHREYQHSEAQCQQQIYILMPHGACHHRPLLEPGLIHIVFQVDHIVQGQGGTAGGNNGQGYPYHDIPLYLPLGGQQHRHIGKGQGENSLIKGNIIQMGVDFLPEAHRISSLSQVLEPPTLHLPSS